MGTGFPKRSCSNKKIEWDDDSKKSHPALARLQAKNPYPQLKLLRLATAKGRLSRCRAARACHARARGDIDVHTVPDLDKATALVPGITNRYCSPSFETATLWPPPAITAKPLRRDEVQLVETQQPHAEERATRASRSMGRKRPTDLSSSVLDKSLNS